MNISKRTLLKHLENNLYVRAKKSDIHGVGIFAIRDIPKDIDPFHTIHQEEYIEFSKNELEHLSDDVKKMIHDYCAEEDGKVWIPKYGFTTVQVERFLNHSKTPNVATTDDGTKFITMRVIKKGEELLADYEHYDENFTEKM